MSVAVKDRGFQTNCVFWYLEVLLDYEMNKEPQFLMDLVVGNMFFFYFFYRKNSQHFVGICLVWQVFAIIKQANLYKITVGGPFFLGGTLLPHQEDKNKQKPRESKAH